MAESRGTTLITGGTDGLGKAGALRLARAGWRVFAGGRNAARRAALEAEAQRENLPVAALEMDVCDEVSCMRALETVRAAGRLDVLVNNAGVGYYAPVEDVRMADWRAQFETNFFSVVRLVQIALPEMRARKQGRIINVSSIAGKFSMPMFGPYSASKYALEAMSDALRLEVHPFGIDVVLIEPGYIPTGFQNAASELSGAYVAGAAQSPYAQLYKNYGKRFRQGNAVSKATPEDFAAVLERAVTARRPRARYTVTSSAMQLSLAKRLLPDAFVDSRIRKSLDWKR